MPGELAALQLASMISGGTSGLKMVGGLVGNYFNRRAALKDIANLPKYQIPGEIQTMLDLYKQRAGAEMPGTDLAKEGIASSQAASLNAAREAGGGAASLNAAAQSQLASNMSYNNLAVQAAQYRAARQAELGGAFQTMAKYKDEAWNINTYNPAMMALNVNQQYRGAQLNTLLGGVEQAGAAGVNYFGQKAYNEQLDKMNPWLQLESMGVNKPPDPLFGPAQGTFDSLKGQYDYTPSYGSYPPTT